MRKIELLAPAGDIERLKFAIEYGADAVYLGGESFGLRSASKNFTIEEIKEGVSYAHQRNVKVFVTLNIVPHDHDLDGLEDYLIELSKAGVDAVIVSDPGVFSIVKRTTPDLPIHISTQASVTNIETILFWYNLGVRRIVLARELSLEEIKNMRNKLPDDLEIEAFVHGAMCMAYSGRCLISNYMTGRDANRGDCAHSCRYKYHLMEETRPGQYYPVFEDERGSFIMNSKDLCMIEYIDELINVGIDSFKIEGRAKSLYYVSTVVRSYRMAIDSYMENPNNYKFDPYLLEEIKKVSHRDFTYGFYFNKPNKDSQVYETSSYIKGYDFVALVLDYNPQTKIATIQQRNRIFNGDEVEVFSPGKKHINLKIQDMMDENEDSIDVAPHPLQIIKFKSDINLLPMDILRKKLD